MVINVIVGTLEERDNQKTFLIMTKFVEKTNHSSIVQTFIDALNLIYVENIKYENILLFVSDAAPYMIKAGGIIKSLCPHLIHLTCLTHGIHRLSEEIRENFREIDRYISNFMKVFKKSPRRINLFKETLVYLSLPPEPVVTRWGTWLTKAIYHATHFESLKKVIFKLEDDCFAITECKKLIMNSRVINSLAYIKANFSNIVDSITEIEGIK